jgi:hypothetical protein
LQELGVDFLLTVKANQRTLHRQITRPFDGTRQIIFLATDYELGLGRDITWTLRAKESPQQRVRDRWSVEVWHWIRDTPSSTRTPIATEAMTLPCWDT